MAFFDVAMRARARLGAVAITVLLAGSLFGATADLAQLRQAAKAGNREAMDQLIRQLVRGSDQDRREAFQWLRELGALGNLAAQQDLARHYLNGVPALNIAPNLVEAELWFYRAARQSPQALREMIAFYHDKSAPARPVRVNEAMQLLNKLVAEGNADMQLLAAQIMLAGRITPKDEPGAVELMRKAAAQGHTDSKLGLADALLRGVGVRQDAAEGAKWIVSAAADGHAHAQYIAGVFHRDGTGVAKDAAAAAKFFRDAANRNHPEATFEYARALYEGAGVEKNQYSAVSQWERVADNIPEAAYRVGLALRDGVGARRDWEKARSFFAKAKQKGYAPASTALDDLLKQMPVESWVSASFALSADESVRARDGRFERRFVYEAQPGDELKLKVGGQITDGATLARSSSRDLVLRYDRGDGRWRDASSLEIKLRFDKRVRAQFVVTTKQPGQTADANAYFTTLTAKPPAPMLEHMGAEFTLRKGYLRTVPLWQEHAQDVIEIRAESRDFDPLLEVGPSKDGKNFRVTHSNDNGGGGTTALIRYSRGSEGEYTARVSAVGHRAGGKYRLLITQPLRFQQRKW